MVGQPEFDPNRPCSIGPSGVGNLTALVHDHDHFAHLVKAVFVACPR